MLAETRRTNWKQYSKVMLERIQVYIEAPAQSLAVDPTDLKMLIDYFHADLAKAMRPGAGSRRGAGRAACAIALTELVPTNTVESSRERRCRTALWRRSDRAR